MSSAFNQGNSFANHNQMTTYNQINSFSYRNQLIMPKRNLQPRQPRTNFVKQPDSNQFEIIPLMVGKDLLTLLEVTDFLFLSFSISLSPTSPLSTDQPRHHINSVSQFLCLPITPSVNRSVTTQ